MVRLLPDAAASAVAISSIVGTAIAVATRAADPLPIRPQTAEEQLQKFSSPSAQPCAKFGTELTPKAIATDTPRPPNIAPARRRQTPLLLVDTLF